MRKAKEGPRGLRDGRDLTTRELVVATRLSAVRDPAVDLLVRQLAPPAIETAVAVVYDPTHGRADQ